jgi:hypothetical protein
MPITQDDLAAVEDIMGTGPASGNSSPNGHNLQGALNVCLRVAEDMNEYGLTLSDLPPEKATEYQQAVADLRHYRAMIATQFSEELAGSLDGIELEDGTVVDFPAKE